MLRCVARPRNPARFEETFLEEAGKRQGNVENVFGFERGIWQIWKGIERIEFKWRNDDLRIQD